MSLSLHSSTECGGSRSFGSRKSRDIVSGKFRIGLISERISSRPQSVSGLAARHSSSPISHLNEAVWSARRSGTSRGSEMRAKEMRRGAREEVEGAEVVRDAAKWGPSEARWLERTPSDPPRRTPWRQRSEQVGGQRKRAVYTQDRLLSRWPDGAGRHLWHCWRKH